MGNRKRPHVPLEIPRIQHRFWVGGPMPHEHVAWIRQWKKLHPRWTHRLWTDESATAFLASWYPKHLECYKEATNPSAASDALRHCLIHHFGGVYLDTDFRPIKPIDELLVGCQAFVTQHTNVGLVSAGLLGAIPGHPLFVKITTEFLTRWDPCDQQKTGPYLVADAVHGRDDVRIFERRLFFHQTYERRGLLDTYTDYPGAYAVHHWAASWLKKRVQPWTS